AAGERVLALRAVADPVAPADAGGVEPEAGQGAPRRVPAGQFVEPGDRAGPVAGRQGLRRTGPDMRLLQDAVAAVEHVDQLPAVLTLTSPNRRFSRAKRVGLRIGFSVFIATPSTA